MKNKNYELKAIKEPLDKRDMEVIDEFFNKKNGDVKTFYKKDNQLFCETSNWDSCYSKWWEVIVYD